MRTSVIEVQDMLSVLGVDELETRICEVTGIESATVDFAAGNATVRYDETRIQMADIKSAVRQRGYESAAAAGAAEGQDHQSHTGPGTPAAPAPAPPKPAPVAPATAVTAVVPTAPPPPMSHAGDEQHDKNAPEKD